MSAITLMGMSLEGQGTISTAVVRRTIERALLTTGWGAR